METPKTYGKSNTIMVSSLFIALDNHRKKGEPNVILMHPTTHRELVDHLRMSVGFNNTVSYDATLTCQGVKIRRTEDVKENHFEIY